MKIKIGINKHSNYVYHFSFSRLGKFFNFNYYTRTGTFVNMPSMMKTRFPTYLENYKPGLVFHSFNVLFFYQKIIKRLNE